MRPPSNEKSYQARWMTLVEALEYIQSTDRCGSVAAQVHLKHEIGHGAVPVKWADTKGPCDIPDVSDLLRSQLVLSNPGLAPDDGSFRPLLVLRQAVLATWPRAGSQAVTRKYMAGQAANAALEGFQSPKKGSTRRAVEEGYEHWMSLVEAIEHIRILYDCNSKEALRQLKSEIGDWTVRVRWENSTGPKDNPDCRRLSTSELLLIGTGIAPDEDEGEGMYRPLLVERSAVQKLWPLPSEKPSRLPACKSEIREALREVYANAADDPPNINEAWKLLKLKLPNAKRLRGRDVLEEDEFASQRRKAGERTKR